MAILDIVKIPAPVLRRKANRITNFDQDLQLLINNMVETMRAAPGVGLAAPQVGVSQRLIVVEYGEEDEEGVESGQKKLFAVINPEIVAVSEEKVNGIEGCLSVPGLIGEVDRHRHIIVKGQNRFGKPIKYKLSGWKARIFQHEIDHLEGIVFTDLASRVWKPTPEEEANILD